MTNAKKQYVVTLIYKQTFKVTVEAESREEAVSIAEREDGEETDFTYYDAWVQEK